MTHGAPGQPSDVYRRYRLDHHSESSTGEELQQRVDREYKTEYGPFGPYIGGLVDPGRVDDLLDRQAAQLKDGVLTRSAPADPGVFYLGIPHQRLYDSVHEGVDPGRVGDMGTDWTELGNKLATFHQAIATAIGNSEADWVGEAGNGARQALADMGNRAGETGVSAQLAGTLFTQQSRALADAKNTVPPPPAEPFDVRAANDRLLSITDPIQLAQQAAADRAAFEQQQKDHQEAARVVETYDRTVAQTSAAQPAFAPAPTPPKERVDPTPAPRPTPETPPGRTPTPTVNGTTETSTATAQPSIPKADPSSQSANTPGGSTQTSGASLTPTYAPVQNPKNGPGTGPLPVIGGAPGRTPSGTGHPPGRSNTPAARPSTPGSRPGGLPGGAAAARAFGTGGAAGFPPGTGTPPGGAAGNPGAATPGAPRSGPTGPGTTAATGRGTTGPGGMPGMPGVGPTGARGEEDIEHETPSYLVEPDPDEVFGTPGTTAPPVIGDWSQ
ncbi:hypothetical protein FHS29_006962 [Saccharothrix tamanrassetensis]|uniref:PPE family protein n=1 Tax=Saccharothrix tamanrassetensis TaxID=1051531 RepID=A0A841CSR2_9PSEU|nr:hypothetical protein [Saccharothrix tamanrassetensis]MBB5960339.1 hypothetical protein [Saccharothrix tamanrassetensis]